ncbi:metal ABC transporter ATPase [Pseudomonas farsensis]|uniref:Metal ABC transporter ATPase n=1 Tax=Pseudomonas farsensis TaxID=2745492 RepID=A0ABU8QRI7_9PSED
MARTLIRKNPSNFKTLALHVEASADGLSYQGVGMPQNFSQTLQRRKAIQLPDTERFVVELANLGVSVRLTLNWQGRDYWVLVRQRRQDRGDVVLKLISGYVPAHELNLPLLTAIQEVAEECLLETPEGWLGGRFNDTWLPTPYSAALHYREAPPFVLSPQSGAARPVQCANLTLMERPRAYVHLPTASLQLIYDLRLQVPREARPLSLFHVDERLEGNQLVARLDRKRPDLYLMPLQDGQPLPELYTVKKDQLQPASTRGLWLAESFARQEGWVVREERVRWKDWLKQQGLAESPRKPAGHLQRFSEKARALLQRARASVHKK